MNKILMALGELLNDMLFSFMGKTGLILFATSQIQKGLRSIVQVATATGVGGGKSRVELNRDWLVSEYMLNILASQANSGTDPTSADPRDFIEKIELVTSLGTLVSMTGAAAYDLGILTESQNTPVTVLGATSTCRFTLEIHAENDGALRDLLTALETADLASNVLEITWSPDATNGFKGGTAPAAASYDLSVNAKQYPTMSNQPDSILGSALHKVLPLDTLIGTAGATRQTNLNTGNHTRFIILHCYDTTSGVDVLSDAVLDNISLSYQGVDYFKNVKATAIRAENQAGRGFGQTGVYVLDAGDDEFGFIALSDAAGAAKLEVVIAGTTPAGYKVEIHQDHTLGL